MKQFKQFPDVTQNDNAQAIQSFHIKRNDTNSSITPYQIKLFKHFTANESAQAVQVIQ
jgi:hypothetical protein